MKDNMVKKRMFYTIAVTLIVVYSTTFAILMTLERMDYRNYLQARYSKNMYDLLDSLENIEENLSKSAIIGTKEQGTIIFQDIFRYASKANDSLHSLPIPQETLNETSKFLSQVGDYGFVLVKNLNGGNELKDEDYANIDRLTEQSYALKEQLTGVLSDINEGRIKWGEIRAKVSGFLANANEGLVSEQFKEIQKQATQYPALIYDGPFSDNVQQIEPKIFAANEVSIKEAEERLKKLLNTEQIASIKSRDTEGETRIRSFSFDVRMKDFEEGESIVCDISKNGGRIVYLLNNRILDRPTIDAAKAVEIGKKYLEDAGYNSMISMYTMTYEDSAVISYVYKNNDVVIYPDQIKLKVALDNGEIIGIETEKYLVSHDENRNIPQPKIDQEAGKKKIGKRLEIKDVRLAVIPTETNKEVFCYEYTGTYKDDTFIVYINAESGEPERILKIINTPNGQLTI